MPAVPGYTVTVGSALPRLPQFGCSAVALLPPVHLPQFPVAPVAAFGYPSCVYPLPRLLPRVAVHVALCAFTFTLPAQRAHGIWLPVTLRCLTRLPSCPVAHAVACCWLVTPVAGLPQLLVELSSRFLCYVLYPSYVVGCCAVLTHVLLPVPRLFQFSCLVAFCAVALPQFSCSSITLPYSCSCSLSSFSCLAPGSAHVQFVRVVTLRLRSLRLHARLRLRSRLFQFCSSVTFDVLRTFGCG